MSTFPKYETYKDSGIDWLGKIPNHWDLVPNRALMSERKEKVGKQASEYTLLSLTLNGVIPRDMENPQGKFPAEFDTYTVVAPQDLVFCLFDIDETPRAVGISRDHGMITGAYNVYSPTARILPKYLYYYYLSLDKTKELKPLYSGLRKTIQRGVFASIKSPLPPKAEQDRIVAFLDTKTAEIDALIQKKERQIQLLDEQKAIRINQAVTRGLNPNLSAEASAKEGVTLKPSGIEWIGDIPEHWEVVPIKRYASVQTGITLGKDYAPNQSIEVPYLRVANVQSGHLSLSSITKIRIPKSMVPRYTLRDGDVLVAEGGDLDKLGRGCLWRSELELCLHQNHVFAVRPNPESLIPEFLSRALGSGYGQKYFMLTGKQTTNLASTNSTALMNFPLARPPADEQQRILDTLDNALESIAKPRKCIVKQIQSLKTLRSTLIAHAVTGKIKV